MDTNTGQTIQTGRVTGLLGSGRAKIVLDRFEVVIFQNGNIVNVGDIVMVTCANNRYDYLRTISAGNAPVSARV
jgi:hypothetical protein